MYLIRSMASYDTSLKGHANLWMVGVPCVISLC